MIRFIFGAFKFRVNSERSAGADKDVCEVNRRFGTSFLLFSSISERSSSSLSRWLSLLMAASFAFIVWRMLFVASPTLQFSLHLIRSGIFDWKLSLSGPSLYRSNIHFACFFFPRTIASRQTDSPKVNVNSFHWWPHQFEFEYILISG